MFWGKIHKKNRPSAAEMPKALIFLPFPAVKPLLLHPIVIMMFCCRRDAYTVIAPDVRKREQIANRKLLFMLLCLFSAVFRLNCVI